MDAAAHVTGKARAAIRQVTLTLQRIPRVATNVQSPLAPTSLRTEFPLVT